MATLAQNAVDQARCHWRIIRGLPARTRDETLSQVLSQKFETFREQLATEHLVATREAMRYGVIAEGWNADKPHGTASMAKALVGGTSLLIAMNDGLISADDLASLTAYHQGEGTRLPNETAVAGKFIQWRENGRPVRRGQFRHTLDPRHNDHQTWADASMGTRLSA